MGLINQGLFNLTANRSLALLSFDATTNLPKVAQMTISGTTLPGEWSSLPGGKENAKRISADDKSMDMAYFLNLFNQYMDEEKRKANLK